MQNVLLISGRPKSRNAEPTTKENNNHTNSNSQQTKTPTSKTPNTAKDNDKEKDQTSESPKCTRKGPQKDAKKPSKSSPVWASLEAFFGAFWG
jgi:hypothetical protein